jgi:hypothetical protein
LWLVRVFFHWADAALAGVLIVGPIYGVFAAVTLAGLGWQEAAAGILGALIIGLGYVALPAVVLAGLVGVIATWSTPDVFSPRFPNRAKRWISWILGITAAAAAISYFVLRDPRMPEIRLALVLLAFPVAVVIAVHIFGDHSIRATRELAMGAAHRGWRRLALRTLVVVQVLTVTAMGILLIAGLLTLSYNIVYSLKGDLSALRWVGGALVVDVLLAAIIWAVIRYGRSVRRQLFSHADKPT